jgi:hypothetical protein
MMDSLDEKPPMTTKTIRKRKIRLSIKTLNQVRPFQMPLTMFPIRFTALLG